MRRPPPPSLFSPQAGHAIALNAGGSEKAASSFYLPLHRVVSALERLRQLEWLGPESAPKVPGSTPGPIVPRGGLRAVFRHQTYDEVRRLGLSAETEERMRRERAASNGLLVIDQVLPGGPADKKLEVGDVLLSIDGIAADGFVPVEHALDTAAAKAKSPDEPASVVIVVERGGVRVEQSVLVEDMHAITPHMYVEMGGAVLHSISHMQARNGNLRLDSGVYVGFAGFVLDTAGVCQHSVITAVGSEPTPTLDAFEATCARFPDRATTTVRYFNIGDQHNEQVAAVRMNHRWFPMARWTRDDYSGKWIVRRSPPPPPPPKTPPRADITFLLNCSATANALIPSLCKVSFDVLHAIDGVHDWHFVGAGLVVDAQRGLVVADRNTVVGSLGEVAVTFAASLEVPARIVFLHPTHNFALIQYDPSAFTEDCGIRAAELDDSCPLAVGDEVEFVGLCRTNPDTCLSQRVTVTEISCINIAQASVPRFRALNEEIAKFDQVVNKSLGGAFIDAKGKVRALWSCFSFYSWNDEKSYEAFHAVSVDIVLDILRPMWADGDSSDPEFADDGDADEARSSALALAADATLTATAPSGAPFASMVPVSMPKMHSLGLGLKRLPLSMARTNMGLSEDWIKRLQRSHAGRSQVLAVSQLLHSSAAAREGTVTEGDLLLAVDGEATSTFRDVESRALGKGSVELTLWRDSTEMRVPVDCELLRGSGTDRVVLWAGLLLQKPYRAIHEMGVPLSGVYCSYYLYGSPAHFYNLKACRYIVEVNGQSVVDGLDAFLDVVKPLGDDAPVRLKTVDLQEQAIAYTLKTDYLFWPTRELKLDNTQDDWQLISHKH